MQIEGHYTNYLTTTIHKCPSHKKPDKERQRNCPILEETKKAWRLNANCYPHLEQKTVIS